MKVIGALVAWDLDGFRGRLKLVSERDDKPEMERRHLARLTMYVIATLAFVSLAMLVQLRFTMEWAMLLALIVVLGFMQIVAWIKK